jgi:hypothetical protein
VDYLDTSVIVTVLTMETTSDDVERWLKPRDIAELLVSDWTVTEVASALSRKLRKGEITEIERAVARREFDAMLESIHTVRVRREDFHAAAKLVDRHDLGLRSADALHLAVADTNGATLWTRDKRLLIAGQSLGIRTASPLEHQDH